VDQSKLSVGQYQGTVTVTAANASGSPATVSVNLTVTAGTISAPSATLTFTQVAGGPAPQPQTVAVTGSPGPINFSLTTSAQNNGTWLTASTGSPAASSGTTPASVQVAVSAGSLTPGTYTGTVTITAPGATGSPISIPVVLNVVSAQTLSAAPTSLSFSYVLGASAPAAQTVQVTTSGNGQFAAAVKTTDGGKWLQATPASGSTPGVLSVSIDPQGLAAGSYTGTITITSPSALSAATVNVSLSVTSVPTPVIVAIKDAASYASGGVAPGENIVIGGTGIGPATLVGLQLDAKGTVSTNVAGTQVLFDNVPAPIVYVSSTQTSVMVPFEVAGHTTTQVQVVYQGAASAPMKVNVVALQPGIYAQNAQGTGPGAILNQDFTINGSTAPAAKGSYIAVYMTGIGQTQPGGTTGAVAPLTAAGQKVSLLPVTATVGGVPVPASSVAYAGTAPGYVEGVIQVNLQIPATAASGAQPLVITFVSSTSSVSFSTQAGITVQVR
jgi:uncharacterized protein (TIGR03437 family)